MVRLLKMFQRPAGALHGVEVGVWQGNLSAYLLERLPQLSIVLVDRWDLGKEEERRLGAGHLSFAKAMDNVAPFWPRWSVMKAESVMAAGIYKLARASFDFVFIDAGHGYEDVSSDAEAWWPLVRPGGLFCGHDYHGRFESVDRAVDNFAKKVNLPVVGHKGHVWSIWK
jgi:predicted O-methyltransferase YrrM